MGKFKKHKINIFKVMSTIFFLNVSVSVDQRGVSKTGDRLLRCMCIQSRLLCLGRLSGKVLLNSLNKKVLVKNLLCKKFLNFTARNLKMYGFLIQISSQTVWFIWQSNFNTQKAYRSFKVTL